MNIFSINKQKAVHNETGVTIIAIKEIWINGELHADCAIPQCDDGKNWYFANATYSLNEITLLA